ncbi:MAG: Gfo/Idh/MocA family protein, partial [Candidatus Hodarchaeota archaeon]
AYNQVPIFYPEIEVNTIKQVVCGTNEAGLKLFAKQFGWKNIELDWRKLVTREDIDLFDNSGPNFLHKEPSIEAAEANKHIICEKPLALTLKDAKEMVTAVEKAGIINLVGFNYRRIPAILVAKSLIKEGFLGRLYHFRACYLQDWITDPNFPMVWRLKKEMAGSGAHGDLNSHIIDLANFLVGNIIKVIGMENTFIKERPISSNDKKELSKEKVTVDDAIIFLAKFENGVLGSFEATRFATGRKNHLAFEINGSKGSLYFNLERLNELNFLDATIPDQGFKNILATESKYPYLVNWWPPGHVIGWEHTFIFQARDLLEAIANDKKISPDFREGAKVQAVLEAVSDSISSKNWTSVQSI